MDFSKTAEASQRDAKAFQHAMELALQEKLNPKHLLVVNDSAKHHGHMGDDGSGATHFKIEIFSELFDGQSVITCHRMVYDALEDFFPQGLHALQIKVIRGV